MVHCFFWILIFNNHFSLKYSSLESCQTFSHLSKPMVLIPWWLCYTDPIPTASWNFLFSWHPCHCAPWFSSPSNCLLLSLSVLPSEFPSSTLVILLFSLYKLSLTISSTPMPTTHRPGFERVPASWFHLRCIPAWMF